MERFVHSKRGPVSSEPPGRKTPEKVAHLQSLKFAIPKGHFMNRTFTSTNNVAKSDIPHQAQPELKQPDLLQDDLESGHDVFGTQYEESTVTISDIEHHDRQPGHLHRPSANGRVQQEHDRRIGEAYGNTAHSDTEEYLEDDSEQSDEVDPIERDRKQIIAREQANALPHVRSQDEHYYDFNHNAGNSTFSDESYPTTTSDPHLDASRFNVNLGTAIGSLDDRNGNEYATRIAQDRLRDELRPNEFFREHYMHSLADSKAVQRQSLNQRQNGAEEFGWMSFDHAREGSHLLDEPRYSEPNIGPSANSSLQARATVTTYTADQMNERGHLPISLASRPASSQPALHSSDDGQLDYEMPVLVTMDYETFCRESFDDDPNRPQSVLSEDKAAGSLSERLTYATELDPQQQEQFLSALSIEEWESAGDWFQAQFSNLMSQMKDARQSKRATAKVLEDKVACRHEEVAKERQILKETMDKMKANGGLVLQESTPKRKRP